MPISTQLLLTSTIYPCYWAGGPVRAFGGMRPPISLWTRSERTSTPPTPSADCRYAIVSPYGSINAVYEDRQRASRGKAATFRTRAPSMRTCAIRWLEDFVLCCRLVPANGPPNSIPVRHPVRSRYPVSAGPLLSETPLLNTPL
jgi:hypothetical protein